MINRARAKAAQLRASCTRSLQELAAREDEAEEVTENSTTVTLRAHRDRKIGHAKARAEI